MYFIAWEPHYVIMYARYVIACDAIKIPEGHGGAKGAEGGGVRFLWLVKICGTYDIVIFPYR